MKNRERNQMPSDIWSFISIGMSIVAIVFSLLRIVPFEIGNDTYIGIIATFIGVIVTIVVGFQVINVFVIDSKLEKIRKIENEVLKQKNTIKETLKRIEDQEKKNHQYVHEMNGKIYLSNGNLFYLHAFSNKEDEIKEACSLMGFAAFQNSIYEFLFFDISQVASSIYSMSMLLKNIKKKPDDDLFRVIVDIEMKIRISPNYSFIKEQYEELMKKFHSKMNT